MPLDPAEPRSAAEGALQAEIYRFGGADRIAMDFSRLELRFAPGNHWHQALWRFDTPAGWLCFPADKVDAIATVTGLLEIDLVCEDGGSAQRFRVQSVLSGYPAGILCFLYSQDSNGWWTGHTIKRSFGKIVVVPCSVDPA